MSIEIRGVTRKFGDFAALSNVSLTVPRGELVALLGPSGSGKTTLLRIIAGLETCDAGSVHFNGEEAMDRDVRDRGVGFVFQHYALFRHMTVFENVAFGLTVRPRSNRPGKAAIRDRVRELLRLVQLESVGDRYPAQLSGGQRQRICIARALALEPKLIICDEAISSLDVTVQTQVLDLLQVLQKKHGLTYIFISHDLSVVRLISDRIAVMKDGKIVEIGTAVEVFSQPKSEYTRQLLDAMPGAEVRV